ncbi:MAG: tRNA dihydrouridine synthase DusB [Proteobacteria bacterium]|nr:tRNA dihydrouridine synthase DusB [Candidatus Enterousia scatequi]
MFIKNQIFAAPLAGITDKPFRRVIRMFSPDVSLVTEMISCHSLVQGHKNCPRNFDRYDDEGNIGAQIFGAEPDVMAEAAKILADQGAKWIDINMGCPVPKVATRSGAGAYLMRDHVLAGKIMHSVVKAVSVPVSIKTRLGWDSTHCDWRDLIDVAFNNGIKFATLHGRTRAQGYTGSAVLPDVTDCRIPVIANGDIKTLADADRAEKLGFSGVMVGRGMLGKPWFLNEIVGENAKPDNVGAVVLQHLQYVIDYYGNAVGVPMFRKHVAWYCVGMPNSADFRMQINTITDVNELKSAICEFWGCVCDI